ncbi:MAG: Rap1a/Tai family immunity protein [Myxococcales bacterium]|nr:Rap1a/Tai family immunity protein [Myxococcales bacterium]
MRRTRLSLLAIALLSASHAHPLAAQKPPDGVALVDSCGTYVRMREGAESYQASQLERTQLCSNMLWAAAEALKARALGADETVPTARREFVRCATDPRAMGPHQSVRVAYRYLTEHPERLHFPAEQLAKEALETGFGCEPATDG